MSWIPYIGQRVLRNKTGQAFEITDVRPFICNCIGYDIKTTAYISSCVSLLWSCPLCGCRGNQDLGDWLHQRAYSPLFSTEAWLEEVEKNSRPKEHPVFGEMYQTLKQKI